MMDRRRALISPSVAPVDYGTQFMPSCLNWRLNGANTMALSADSLTFKINKADWGFYAYATRTLTMRYSDLLGKTVIIDYYDNSADGTKIYTGLGLWQDPNTIYGLSAIHDKVSFNSTSDTPHHYHREIVIGTDYVSTWTNEYLSLVFNPYNANAVDGPFSITDIKCGYK